MASQSVHFHHCHCKSSIFGLYLSVRPEEMPTHTKYYAETAFVLRMLVHRVSNPLLCNQNRANVMEVAYE